MNSWSAGRKKFVLFIVITALIILVGIPVFFLFYKAPTCSDGKRNSDETGVDCGGSCELLCTAESLPILARGDAQVLRVSTTTYEVVQVAENANVRGEVYKAGYTFKIYDSENAVPLKVIEGETFVPKNSKFAIFEGPFNFAEGSSTPARATFQWKEETLIWKKNTDIQPQLVVKDEIITQMDTRPRLEAVLLNNSLEKVTNIELVAIIEDANGNMIAASRTYVNSLDKGESVPLVFTWPTAFQGEPGGIEIIPRILPDRSFLR